MKFIIIQNISIRTIIKICFLKKFFTFCTQIIVKVRNKKYKLFKITCIFLKTRVNIFNSGYLPGVIKYYNIFRTISFHWFSSVLLERKSNNLIATCSFLTAIRKGVGRVERVKLCKRRQVPSSRNNFF